MDADIREYLDRISKDISEIKNEVGEIKIGMARFDERLSTGNKAFARLDGEIGAIKEKQSKIEIANAVLTTKVAGVSAVIGGIVSFFVALFKGGLNP